MKRLNDLFRTFAGCLLACLLPRAYLCIVTGSDRAISQQLQHFYPKRSCFSALERHFRRQIRARKVHSVPAAHTPLLEARSHPSLILLTLFPIEPDRLPRCANSEPRLILKLLERLLDRLPSLLPSELPVLHL